MVYHRKWEDGRGSKPHPILVAPSLGPRENSPCKGRRSSKLNRSIGFMTTFSHGHVTLSALTDSTPAAITSETRVDSYCIPMNAPPNRCPAAHFKSYSNCSLLEGVLSISDESISEVNECKTDPAA